MPQVLAAPWSTPSRKPAGFRRAAGSAWRPPAPTRSMPLAWYSTPAAKLGERGLRFCGALSGLLDLVELVREPASDRRRRSFAGFLHGLAGPFATAGVAAGEAVLGKRSERRRRRHRDQFGDQRALQQLDEGVAGVEPTALPARPAAASRAGTRNRSRTAFRTLAAAALGAGLLRHCACSCLLGFRRSTHLTRVSIPEAGITSLR